MVAASQLGINLPVAYILDALACKSEVRGAKCLPRTGMVCGLSIWSVDKDERLFSIIQSSIFSPLLLSSAYPQLGEWPLKSPVMSRLWLTSGRVCSCRSLSGGQ